MAYDAKSQRDKGELQQLLLEGLHDEDLRKDVTARLDALGKKYIVTPGGGRIARPSGPPFGSSGAAAQKSSTV